MEEIWKDYIYTYQISNLGRLKNTKTNRILKFHKTKTGYLGTVVSMGSKENYKMIRVHRAVAEAFIPNPNSLPEVNHKDGNKSNNRIDNLEWVTSKGNTIHAIKNGLRVPLRGEKNGSSKLKKEDVIFIRTNYKPNDRKFGTRALAKKYDVHHETIRQVLNNKTWI